MTLLPSKVSTTYCARKRPFGQRTLAAVLAVLAATAAPAAAEVALGQPKEPPAVKVAGGPDAGRRAGIGGPNSKASLRCWQGGTEVVSEADYTNVQVGALAQEHAIRLEGGSTLLAMPFGETLCLVKVE